MDFRHTSREEEVIRACSTASTLQTYLDNLAYESCTSEKDYVVGSFRRTVDLEQGLCLSGALTAAHILECHGYQPCLLVIDTRFMGHSVAVYQDYNELWGAVGLSRFRTLRSRRPTFSGLEELTASYVGSMDKIGLLVTGARLSYLDLMHDIDWRFSRKNLFEQGILEALEEVSIIVS